MVLPPCNLPINPPWRKKYTFTEYPRHDTNGKTASNASRLSLRTYAEKCFASCQLESAKDLMENTLKAKLAKLNQEEISSMDWGNEPIPMLSEGYTDPLPVQKRICITSLNSQTLSVIGTSTSLEKPYFRLTSEADPSTVRPEKVLKESFVYVLKKWENEHNVAYIVEQLKSIRQDLSIQSIRNPFTIEVYETNCKIALSENLFDELIQCLGQLMTLYKTYPGKAKDEFICYHMLYMLFSQNYSEYNILIRRSNMKSKTLSFCQTLSRAIYERNCFDLVLSLRKCPYSSSLIVKNICEKFFVNILQSFLKAFKTECDKQNFLGLFLIE